MRRWNFYCTTSLSKLCNASLLSKNIIYYCLELLHETFWGEYHICSLQLWQIISETIFPVQSFEADNLSDRFLPLLINSPSKNLINLCDLRDLFFFYPAKADRFLNQSYLSRDSSSCTEISFEGFKRNRKSGLPCNFKTIFFIQNFWIWSSNVSGCFWWLKRRGLSLTMKVLPS